MSAVRIANHSNPTGRDSRKRWASARSNGRSQYYQGAKLDTISNRIYSITSVTCNLIQGHPLTFAERIAKAQTKAAAGPTNSLARQSAPLVAHQPGHDVVGLVHMLQGTIGNQATIRLLAQRAQNLTRDAPRGHHGQAAATMAQEMPQSPGQSLDPAVRTFAEARFGHDFSQVKVHTDARAAESARGVNALAYTSGNHIAFDTGQYAPATPAGMRLLGHELTHVVQQRFAPVLARGVSVADDPHERQAGAVADALMQGGHVAGLLDSRPGPISQSLQRQPAPPPPPHPMTYDRTIYHLKPVPKGLTVDMVKQQLRDKIKLGAITSIATKGGTGNAEIFLLSILFALADRKRWHTEADIVTAIDWPKPGTPAPLGQVTVRIDDKGAASAELIATGVPAVTQQTSAAALQADYKLASVRDDGTATWSAAELNDVAAALAILPPADKAALEDVELVRVDKIPGHPDRAGQFEAPEHAAVAAEEVKRHAMLTLATSAFTHDTLQFAGGTAKTVPASFQAILHEVGHAVETQVYRQKWRSHAQALADTKAAGNVQESQARKKERKDVEDKLKATRNPAEKKRLEKRLGKFDLDLALSAGKATDKKAAETKLTAKEKEVLDMEKGPTDRLAKFVDMVAKNHIVPITDYSKQGDKEFYAEAYSLWLVDPEFLQNNYKAVYEFFQHGDYRN